MGRVVQPIRRRFRQNDPKTAGEMFAPRSEQEKNVESDMCKSTSRHPAADIDHPFGLQHGGIWNLHLSNMLISLNSKIDP